MFDTTFIHPDVQVVRVTVPPLHVNVIELPPLFKPYTKILIPIIGFENVKVYVKDPL